MNIMSEPEKDSIKGKTTGVLKEFKEFISRGNVMDMAVGVIMGSAFTSIVSSLVDDMLMPVIGMITGGLNFKDMTVTIPWGNNPVLNFGNFIQSIIYFILVALCVFIIIKVLNIFSRKKETKEEEPPKPANEEVLLTEIRDLLKGQNEE